MQSSIKGTSASKLGVTGILGRDNSRYYHLDSNGSGRAVPAYVHIPDMEKRFTCSEC